MIQEILLPKGIPFADTYYLTINVRGCDTVLVMMKKNTGEKGLYSDMLLTLMSNWVLMYKVSPKGLTLSN